MTSRPASTRSNARAARGFTLIELVIAMAVIGLLTAVALPSYRSYILRGQLVDATTALASFRGNMERYYQDNRTYASVTVNGSTIYPPCDTNNTAATRTVGSFVIACSGTPTSTAFTLAATGSGSTSGFTYTVNQLDTRATTAVPTGSGFSTSTTCWVLKKGQTC